MTRKRDGLMTITVDDRELQAALVKLRQRAPHEIKLIAETLAALGKEYARDIVTVMIYATPERSGYKRTRFLLRSIYSEVQQRKGQTIITLGAGANYAAFNEFGTYDGWLGEGAEAQILADARAAGSDLITLEYGNPGRGLEPRPFIIPALVQLEKKAPELVMRAVRRMTRGGRN